MEKDSKTPSRFMGLTIESKINPWLLLTLPVVIIAPFWICWLVPSYLSYFDSGYEEDKRKFDSSLALSKEIVAVLGTAATIVGGFFLYLNFRVADKNAKLAEDRLITERFSKAIEQLAHEKQSVNMGAIYTLGKIAQEAPSSYHWTVMELLSAYIREKSPTTPNTLDNQPEESEPIVEFGKTERLHSDIQAALTVIGNRHIEYDPPSQTINLMNTNLRGANLRKAQLSDANLSNCDLRQTDLSGAVLIEADLRATDFSGATLTDTNCSQANLAEAKFRNAQLSNVDFEGADLKKTDFSQAMISRSKFSRATYLGQANFTKASCIGIDLSDIPLQGTIFHKANLIKANFYRAPIRAVNFSEAKLQLANFSHSKLQHIAVQDDGHSDGLPTYPAKFHIYPVNFSGARLAGASFENAAISEEIDFTKADVDKTNFQGVIGPTHELIEVAENWQKARYSSVTREQLGLPPIEDADAQQLG